MRILDLVEQVSQRAEAQGGMTFLSPSRAARGEPPSADPHWRPAPDPTDGVLVQDPDFALPTTAGPLTWRLFHTSAGTRVRTEWGLRRRASFPLRLTSVGTTVTVMHEDGQDRQYQKQGDGTYLQMGAPCGDTLVKNGDGSWDETRGDTGLQFHFPAGGYVSMAYRATPQGLRLTYNYLADGRLQSILEPAG